MQTTKAFQSWYEAQPREQICSDCGKVGDRAYVQPQWPGFYKGRECPAALCGDCITVRHRKVEVERKLELAALPRCEIDGCKRRGAWRVGTSRVLLCGRHKKATQRGVARLGILGALELQDGQSRETVLQLATIDPAL